jgi:hypothetical protein
MEPVNVWLGAKGSLAKRLPDKSSNGDRFEATSTSVYNVLQVVYLLHVEHTEPFPEKDSPVFETCYSKPI